LRQHQGGAFPASCCQLHAVLPQELAEQPCQLSCERPAGLLQAEHLLLQLLLTV
jgi:hypothetical protein